MSTPRDSLASRLLSSMAAPLKFVIFGSLLCPAAADLFRQALFHAVKGENGHEIACRPSPSSAVARPPDEPNARSSPAGGRGGFRRRRARRHEPAGLALFRPGIL